MLIVLFIIFLIVIIIGMGILKITSRNYNYEEMSVIGELIIGIGCVAEFIVIFFAITCIVAISQLTVSDSKIKMYQQENDNIQKEISTIVKDYIDYEKETTNKIVEDIDTSNLVFLTELYPELKTNSLINKQIDIYVDNNNKIKMLKENRLDNLRAKWWLYFGKIEEE